MKKFELAIVIVTFKSENLIEKCLDSVYDFSQGIDLQVVLSDNSPNDDTSDAVSKIKSKYQNLTFIKNAKNEGFSKGNNIAIEKVNSEYVLFLNPDMILEKNTLKGMLEFIKKNPAAGTATCKVVLMDGKLDDSCHRGFPTPWRALCHFSKLSKIFPKSRLFSGYNLTYLDFTKTHEIDAVAGSFMIMKYDLGEKLRWWDEDYFFYGEDIDFCYRIKQLGQKIYFVPEYKALHFKGASSGIKKISKNLTTANKETKLWVTRQRFLAMEIFYDKHYKDKYPSILRMIVMSAIKLKYNFAKLSIELK